MGREMRPSLKARQLLSLLAVFAWNPQWALDGSQTHFQLGFDSTLYPFLSRSFQTFEARSKASWVGNVVEGGVQAETFVMIMPQDPFHFEVNEAYVSTSRKLAPVQLSLGRQLQHWSGVDEVWKMGVWQPRFVWDPLNPDPVAFTGATLMVKQPTFRITAFATPLYLPERGMGMSVANGAVTSASPWVSLPPTSMTIFGQNTPMRYDVAMPSITSVLIHPGASGSARFGGDVGFWGQLGYAYKPLNQIIMGYDGSLGTDGVLNATVYPRFLYHHLITGEAAYSSQELELSLSTMAEVPVRDQTPSAWSTQEVTPSVAGSFTAEWKPNRTLTMLRASYLLQAGGNAPDQGALSTGGSLFGYRYPFQNALLAEIDLNPVRFSGGGLLIHSKLTYDLLHQGFIFSPQVKLAILHSLLFGLGFDLLASAGTGSGPDFVRSNLGNSRVYSGVNYVF